MSRLHIDLFVPSAEDQYSDGQCVGAIDAGGAAEAAGLKSGDRIMTVNGLDVMYANHRLRPRSITFNVY